MMEERFEAPSASEFADLAYDIEPGGGISSRSTNAAVNDVLIRAVQATEQSLCVADVTAKDGPLVWVNDAFMAMTGYGPDEVLGRNCRFLQDGLPAEVTAGPARELGRIVRERTSGVVVIPNLHKNGTIFHNEVSLSPLREEDGEVRFYVAVQRDVTERVKAEQDRDAAREEVAQLGEHLQRQLVPRRLLPAQGYQIAVRHQGATRSDGTNAGVSGDFYDVFTVPAGTFATLGDVSGRGPRAAASTTAVRWALRGAASSTSPADLLLSAGEAVYDPDGERFATVAGLHLPENGNVTFALAGHPQLVHLPVEGSPRFVGATGTLLGPFPDVEVTDTHLELEPGGMLVLYTDGVTEAARGHELLGEEGLLSCLERITSSQRAQDGAAELVADLVLEAVAEWVGGGLVDDLTLMVVQRRP